MPRTTDETGPTTAMQHEELFGSPKQPLKERQSPLAKAFERLLSRKDSINDDPEIEVVHAQARRLYSRQLSSQDPDKAPTSQESSDGKEWKLEDQAKREESREMKNREVLNDE